MANLVSNPQFSISPLIDQGTETLFYNFSNILQEAYTHTPMLLADRIAIEVPASANNGLTTDLYWEAMPPALKVWIGSRQYKNVTSRASIFKHLRFELTVQLDRNVVMNDKTGVFSRTLGLMGKQLARWADQQVSLALECGNGAYTAGEGEDPQAVGTYNSNANNYWDGVPFFSKNHPISLNGSVAGTQANVQTGVSNLTESTLAAAIELLQAQRNEDGLVAGLGLEKILLIVPTNLYFAAKRLVKAEFFGDELSSATAGTVDNKGLFQGMVEVIVNPYLQEASSWYIADGSMGLKGLALVRSMTELTVLASPENPIVFDKDVVVYGAKAFGGVAYGSHLPLIRVTNLSA